MLVLITGGCGFIGLAAARMLRDAGHAVRLLSSRPLSKFAGFDVICGDVRDPASLAGALKGAEAIVVSHQFRGFPIEKPATGDTFHAVDADGTRHVIAAAKAHGDVQRLVYLSGAAVRETTRDAHPGIAAKWTAEQHVRESGLPWVILRASIVYGPGDHYFSQLASFIEKGPLVPVFGDGRALAQPIYISDLARTITAAVEAPPEQRLLLDACGPDTLSTNAILDSLMSALGRRRPVLHLPLALINGIASVLERLPAPPLTRGLIAFSKFDNTSHGRNADAAFGLTYCGIDDGIRRVYGRKI